MLSKIKLCMMAGVVSLAGIVASYGVCDLKKVGEKYDAFMEQYVTEMACCLNVMIKHHRQHGITAENKQKLMDAINKVEEVGEDLLEVKRLFIDGLVTDKKSSTTERGDVFKSTKLIPFEEDEPAIELLKGCSKAEPMTYEAAFKRFLEIGEIAYQECHRLTHDEL